MRLIFTWLITAFSMISFAQDQILYCGQVEATEKIFERFPHLEKTIHEDEQRLEEFTVNRSGGGNEVYVIPTVFHIIHNNGPENISDEQVYDAMYVLNRDFRMLNEDIEDVVEEFQDVTADIEIEFKLATIDPEGNCTKGINRIQSQLTYQGDDEMKELIQWPRDMYLNVWVCAYANGAAGYTFLPGSVNNWQMEDQDGIVLKYDYTGSIGESNEYRSRTLTHECGHWLNLRHCWGPGNSPGDSENCDWDDNVPDTPNSLGWASCALSGTSCGSLDNVQNYMEYSYCGRMFTEGQKTRMRAAAESNIAERSDLWEEDNLIDTGVFEDPQLCTADFVTEREVVCVGQEITFMDESFHEPMAWEWDFGDGTIISGDDPEVHKNPIHVFEEPGFYTVSLTVSNSNEEASVTKSDFVQVLPDGVLVHPFWEGFEGSINDWYVYDQSIAPSWETSDQAGYTGSRSMRIENIYSDDGDIDQFVSVTFDASDMSELEIQYKYAWAPKVNVTDDMLRVYVSGDCGENWSLKAMHRGFTDLPTVDPQNSYFIPSGQGDWDQHTIVLDDEQFLTSTVRVMFEFRCKGGNNIYVDDINIHEGGYVGVPDLSDTDSEISIYPNPATDQARVDVAIMNSGRTTLEVLNPLGQIVERVLDEDVPQGNQSFYLNTKAWSDGIYLVRLQNNGLISTRRLVVR